MYETFSDNVGLVLVLSLGAAAITVAAIALRAWTFDRLAKEPPVLRHVMAYFLAYLFFFFALDQAETRPWLLVVAGAIGMLAFAVSVHGNAPLWTREFGMSLASAAAFVAALLALYFVMLLFGIDISERDLVPRD